MRTMYTEDNEYRYGIYIERGGSRLIHYVLTLNQTAACCTGAVISSCLVGDASAPLTRTNYSGRLRSHPKQKMEEPRRITTFALLGHINMMFCMD